MKNKIFLGGTCAETTWRNDLIRTLNQIEYFNPVVEDWTPECQQVEINEKENHCNIHFYCITKEMQGHRCGSPWPRSAPRRSAHRAAVSR